MDSVKKEQIIKVGVAALGVAIAGYIIYKLTHRETVETVTNDPFKNVVDQRAP